MLLNIYLLLLVVGDSQVDLFVNSFSTQFFLHWLMRQQIRMMSPRYLCLSANLKSDRNLFKKVQILSLMSVFLITMAIYLSTGNVQNCILCMVSKCENFNHFSPSPTL